jgi:hypothetical protein
VITTVIIIAVAVYAAFHLGHSHSNYRHGRASGHRGVNLFWSSTRGPWVSIPGPFGTRIGHRLLPRTARTPPGETETRGVFLVPARRRALASSAARPGSHIQSEHVP